MMCLNVVHVVLCGKINVIYACTVSHCGLITRNRVKPILVDLPPRKPMYG